MKWEGWPQRPLLACFFAAATFATIGLPGFGNFWGEFDIPLLENTQRII